MACARTTGADVSLLRQIAAGYLSFGQYEKAIGLLRLSLWIDPDCQRSRDYLNHAIRHAEDVTRDTSSELLN